MAPALHHGEPSRGGVPAKGSAIGIVAPVVAPREMASLQGKKARLPRFRNHERALEAPRGELRDELERLSE